ncbi:serine/threonine-protein phosphatase [Streptomyces sp. N2-109]|uniref:Serine/threonine-protein phosphatase n=1 Tax=Streptomyces gossypii TaxID=2883101 RepID=A0ABT2JT12_9ACTN|nr:PP2C family serine/threonine-protein phosphatase [Streptomyces gossypii]MCT2590500.1 serine/threonine-protein phosphatase [Streptomyces gossypii]
MPQLDQVSDCPGCAEPLEEGDLFCGACGADLRTAVPAAGADADRPTLAVNGARLPPADAGADFTLSPAEPPAPDASALLPPPAATPAATPGTVPDPRTVDPLAAATGEPEPLGPRCVACGTGTIDDDGYCEHCGHKQPHARDHMEHELGTVAAASDRGLRHHHNEDFFAIDEPALADGSLATIAVVCDGVSSASRSDEASTAAAEAACSAMRGSVPRGVHIQQAMHDALFAAAEAVSALATEADAEAQRNAPACTIVSAVIAGGLLTVGWVGDSRAYWVPDDRTARSARLTEDDSWAAQMVAAGLMNEPEAYADSRAHAITGWLGADAYDLDPHTASFKPDRAGVVVVCTDGLWNYAESAEEMAAAVPHDARLRPLHSAQHLVGYALDAGGHDNVTVAIVPFPMLPEGAGSA